MVKEAATNCFCNVTLDRGDDFCFWNGDISTDYRRSTTTAKFLVRKIRKITKILKLLMSKRGARSSTTKPSLEEEQNAANERLSDDCSGSSHSTDKSWDNLETRYLSTLTMKTEERKSQNAVDNRQPYFPSRYHSVCYVFMPDQAAPVAVKLRTARIPGGVLCVTYRPDEDICNNKNSDVRSYTSFQRPQAQQALIV